MPGLETPKVESGKLMIFLMVGEITRRLLNKVPQRNSFYVYFLKGQTKYVTLGQNNSMVFP